MDSKGLMEESVLRIAVCDDDKSDRERVSSLVQEYLKETTRR